MEEILNVLLEIKKEITDSFLLNKEVFTLQEFCKFYRPGGKMIYIDRQDAVAYLRQNPVSSLTAKEQAVNNYLLTSKTAA
jgi:hypothetical protein